MDGPYYFFPGLTRINLLRLSLEGYFSGKTPWALTVAQQAETQQVLFFWHNDVTIGTNYLIALERDAIQ